LPYAGYPERIINGICCYQFFIPYLHSHHLRWTFGSIRGHFGDEWFKRTARLPLEPMVATLAQAECVGIYVDRDGYADHGEAIERDLAALLGAGPIVSETGRRAYFDLRPFTHELRSRTPVAEWQRCHETALHPIVPLYRNGFYWEETFPQRGHGHWGGQSAELHLRNDLQRPRVVRVRMQVDLPGRRGESTLQVSGPSWEETISINAKEPSTIERCLTLGPGNHVVRLQCDAAPITAVGDPWRRRRVFRVTNLECVEELRSEE
jgi:hypothetical protein